MRKISNEKGKQVLLITNHDQNERKIRNVKGNQRNDRYKDMKNTKIQISKVNTLSMPDSKFSWTDS